VIEACGDVEVQLVNAFDVMKLCDQDPLISAKIHRLLAKKLSIRVNTIGDIEAQKDISDQMSSRNLDDTTSGDNEILQKFKISGQTVIKEFNGVKRSSKNSNMKGDLFLTQEYLCFLGISRIAIEKKIKYAYEDISKIEINDEKSLSIYEQDEYKCSFTFYDDITEVHTYMIRQWNMIKEKEQNESTIRLKKQNIDENKVGKLFPSRKRTQTLIDYSKHVTYNKGDLIVDQGITLQPAIYFLTEGSIEVDKDF